MPTVLYQLLNKIYTISMLATNYQPEKIDINIPIPHPNNYLEHPEEQIRELTRSVKMFGIYRYPILQKSTNHILIGHGLIQALKKLDYKEIQVYIIDCSDNLAKKLLLADNKITQQGVHSHSKHLSLLQLMQDADIPGFDSRTISTVINNASAFVNDISKKAGDTVIDKQMETISEDYLNDFTEYNNDNDNRTTTSEKEHLHSFVECPKCNHKFVHTHHYTNDHGTE